MYRNILLAFAAILCASSSALAQSARSGGGGGNAQLIQQLQQLGAERTQLQAENERMKKELDGLRKERDALKAGQQSLTTREKAATAEVARNAQQRETTENELAQQKARMQELVAKFRETAQNLRDVETDRASKTQQLTARDAELKSCIDHNQALYTLNGEILDRLEHQSLWSHLARSEPFTQIKRTQLENLVDDYKQRAEDQRAAAQAPSTSAPQH